MDVDWAELCEQFMLSCSPETLRKAGVGIKLVSDADMMFAGGQDGESASSFDRPMPNTPTIDELSDGYIERQKLRQLQGTVREIYRAESRSEMLRESVREAVKGLPDIKVREHRYEDEEEYPHVTDNSGGRTLVLAIGDIHYGADILVKGLCGETINRFNSTVFEKRMDALLERVRQILAKEHISTVHMMMVGDLIDGMLRQSQLMKIEYGLVDSTIHFSEYMSQWVNLLSESCSSVKVYAASGNHSEIRPLGSKKREFEQENMERIILWYMETRLEHNNRVYVCNRCDRYLSVDILGYRFLLMHGDTDKDLERMAADTVRLYGFPIDFFVCGHRHRESEFPAGITSAGDAVIIRVPSICGTDGYAQTMGFGGYAGAIATVIKKDYGRECIYPIRLQ